MSFDPPKKLRARPALALLLLTGLLAVAGYAADGSLELKIASQTEAGPLLEPIHGCFEYGAFYANVTNERINGVPLEFQLKRLGKIAKHHPNSEGMEEFLRNSTNEIYNLPPGFLGISYKKRLQRAIDRCRKADGRTWLFEPMWTAQR